ncbi:MAG: arginine decarboxylase, pyruvoyl-dependent [Archaeoglobaceae archaeon]
MKFVPRAFFLTSGVGSDEEKLVSFELALRDAGIERFNLVPVSSILPRKCKLISAEEGLEELEDGQIVFCVMARFSSGEVGREIYASVAAAMPKLDVHGYIAESSGYWFEGADRYAEKLAARLISGKCESFELESVTARARVEKLTTAIAAAVFVP